MTYEYAKKFLQTQDRNIRRVNGIKIQHNGYEYRLTYKGGFASYVAIDRREIGRRNFKYFGGVGAYHCWTATQVIDLVMQEINKKTA